MADRLPQQLGERFAGSLTWPQVKALLSAHGRAWFDETGSRLAHGTHHRTRTALATMGVVEETKAGDHVLTDLGEQTLILLQRRRIRDLGEQLLAVQGRR